MENLSKRKKLPNVIFQRELKHLLNNKISHDNDNYIGITSPYQNFIKNLEVFWRKYNKW